MIQERRGRLAREMHGRDGMLRLTISASGFWLIAAGLIASASGAAPLGAQAEPPLPDGAAFLATVRANLFTDEELQRDYTYLEKREEIRVSKLGRVHIGRTRVFEVYPSPEPGHSYRRLIAENGKPLDPRDLAERDAAYLQYVTDLHHQRTNETAAGRARREAKIAQDRKSRDEIVADVFRIFQAEMLGRDRLLGHRTIVFSLVPRPNVAPRTKLGRYFPSFKGRVWIDETDHQVMKVVMDTIESINIGWGILGRVHEGSVFTFERRKVNGEVWLPHLARIEVKGRSVLFRKFDLVATTEYSNYRRFSVSTTETFTNPSPQ
jgi:hypothetical protein